MRIAIPREVRAGERRVAGSPESVEKLIKLGFEVSVLSGAGERASYLDEAYERAGATIVADPELLWKEADIVLKVLPPETDPVSGVHEADRAREGQVLICFAWPAKNRPLIERLAARRVTLLAMDQIPRITRAQKMDALSSMANIAGYRAVIEAASYFGRFFTGQMTAAGKVPPAKVLVIGAGVAGLAAIGAARGLGAVVRAFDTRPAVAEQVQSMGADFLTIAVQEDGTGEGGYAKQMSDAFLKAEQDLFEAQAAEVDIIITTALIPGRPAPQLITEEAVARMKPGSVIVDLAAESGGNCALTRPEEVVHEHGVTIIGYVDLPSRLAPTASTLYGNNLVHLLTDMGGAAKFRIDEADEVVRGALVLRDGEWKWPPPKPAAPPSPQPTGKAVAPKPAAPTLSGASRPVSAAAHVTGALPPVTPEPAQKPKAAHGHGAKGGADSGNGTAIAVAIAAVVLLALGWVAPAAFVAHLTVFVLACFVGWQIVWNVTPALHTPLMSVTNAISGIILVGGMLLISRPEIEGAVEPSVAVVALSAGAVLLATINIAGGFLVTQRMLRMFQK